MNYNRILFVLLVCLVSACGPREEINQDAFKVGLLTPGPVSDAGWNAGAYEGLVLIKKELDAVISQVETKTPAEFEQGFRDYARLPPNGIYYDIRYHRTRQRRSGGFRDRAGHVSIRYAVR
jgi:basic membrane lipoprotein Med (substrate-binding protein (PBP1-ABC) superfamily)